MSADNESKTSLKGQIIKTSLGGTSKSAHMGFVLQNKDGNIKLRRENGNPFYDDFFEAYENKNVKVEGYDMEQYFLVSDIEVLK